jgi:drug/metabolite transporter (DMT)-like permease
MGWRKMKAAVVIWALLALCGVALAIFAADGVSKILGILLALVGVIGFIQARRRQNK